MSCVSVEPAVGKFPVEAVRMMRQIIEFTEKARLRVVKRADYIFGGDNQVDN